jgi:hypothetical protein
MIYKLKLRHWMEHEIHIKDVEETKFKLKTENLDVLCGSCGKAMGSDVFLVCEDCTEGM